MTSIVLDSSVFIKLFIDEEDSQTTLSLMDSIMEEKTQILVPHIFYYEVFGIARKRGVDCMALLDVLVAYQNSILTYVEHDVELTKKVIEITERGSIKSGYPSFYDASYHAIAMLNDCDFITADRKNYEKTKHLGHIKLLEQA
jgi:predicted nucleic acid-binding protein